VTRTDPGTEPEPDLSAVVDASAERETVPDGGAAIERRRGPYVESTVIMTTVRVVAPFVFTLGLFVMFHGAGSPGGGFQGGAIVSAVILMLAIAFGIEPTREWLDATVLKGIIAAGVLVFVAIGLGSLALGVSFLEYAAYAPYVPHASKYGIELVELGIGAIVAGVLTGLFFAIAAGYGPDSADSEGGDSW